MNAMSKQLKAIVESGVQSHLSNMVALSLGLRFGVEKIVGDRRVEVEIGKFEKRAHVFLRQTEEGFKAFDGIFGDHQAIALTAIGFSLLDSVNNGL